MIEIVSRKKINAKLTSIMLREIVVVVLVIALTTVSINAEIHNNNVLRRKTSSVESIISRNESKIDSLQLKRDINSLKGKILTTYTYLGTGSALMYTLLSGVLAMGVNPIFIIFPPILSLITGGFIQSGVTDNLLEKRIINDKQKDLMRKNKDLEMTIKALRMTMFSSSTLIVYLVELVIFIIIIILFVGLCLLGGILSDNSIPEDQL